MRHYVFVGVGELTQTFLQSMVSLENEAQLSGPINILAAFEQPDEVGKFGLTRISDYIYRNKAAPKFMKEMVYLQALDTIEGGLPDEDEANEHGIAMAFNPYVLCYTNDEQLMDKIGAKTDELREDNEVVVVVESLVSSEFLEWCIERKFALILLNPQLDRVIAEVDADLQIRAPIIHAGNVILEQSAVVEDLVTYFSDKYLDDTHTIFPFESDINGGVAGAQINFVGGNLNVHLLASAGNELQFKRMKDLYVACTNIFGETINDHVLCLPEEAVDELQSFLRSEWKDFFRKDRRTGVYVRLDPFE